MELLRVNCEIELGDNSQAIGQFTRWLDLPFCPQEGMVFFLHLTSDRGNGYFFRVTEAGWRENMEGGENKPSFCISLKPQDEDDVLLWEERDLKSVLLSPNSLWK